ncbi:MAG: sugar ABC transporter ATP-binding protein [Acidimicrobiia bacterium]|nr:MAG: sugar ABC transporter ATP-binding protein [Acidimicrobiia bacterium]
MSIVLQARGIRKSFGGVEVLHGVDLDAPAGSVVALLGENGAGKSTLVKIISGAYAPSAGEIIIDGRAYQEMDPRTALQLGIAVISQEFQDAATLTVAENIALGRWPKRKGVVSWRLVRRKAGEVLDSLEVEIGLDRLVGTLKVGERQLIEIARALCRDARLLILDEPTAALSYHEAEVLFNLIRRLKNQGVAIVYITHRLDEVEQLADYVQVLRDGSTALLAEVDRVDRASMIEAMIGRRASAITRPLPASRRGDPVLEWRGASSHGAFAEVDAVVHRGEVVGLYGKLGSGADSVAETAFGLRRLDSGSLLINEREVAPKNPIEAIRLGVGYLPPERKSMAAFMDLSVAANVAAASWRDLATGLGIMMPREEANAYRRWHERLSIRSTDEPGQLMRTLSGGNQQKAILGRWLQKQASVLVLVEPTRGVDVGAREDIYKVLRSLAEGGMGILVVTSDYEEAFQLADRVYVMSKGRVAGHLTSDDVTTGRLLEMAGG